MNKKTTLSIVLIAIISLALATWFIQNQITDLQNQISELKTKNSELQDQNSDLQNQINELQLQNREKQDRLTDFTYELAKERHLHAKITAFSWEGGFHPYAGQWLEHPVNVTVQNNDVVPLCGLRLIVRLVNRNTGTEIGYSGGTTIDRLDAGENWDIYNIGGLRTTLDTSLSDAVCVVMLTAGDIVLDEGTYDLS